MNAAIIEKNDDMRDLYRQLILDHARSPRHFGKLDDATSTADGINPLCGDKLRLYVRLDADQSIAAASFEGSGCAISVASASLMTDTIIGLELDQAIDCCTAICQRLTGANDNTQIQTDVNIDKIKALDGVREYPSRVKCATLAWRALESSLQGNTQPISTE